MTTTTPAASDGFNRTVQKLAQTLITALASDKTTYAVGGKDSLEKSVGALLSALDAGVDSAIVPVTRSVITTTATLTPISQTVIVNDTTAGAAVTITLPAAATNAGRTYTVKKIGNTANVTIDANAAETIDGATTLVLTVQYASATIYCNGTAWFVI